MGHCYECEKEKECHLCTWTWTDSVQHKVRTALGLLCEKCIKKLDARKVA